jgi:Predicted glutamine amidotransferases
MESEAVKRRRVYLGHTQAALKNISREFLRQKVADSSVLSKDMDPERDRLEFKAVQEALSRGLPILAICKGLQVPNVALGGTPKLDIKGHNLPEQRDRDVQPLRSGRRAAHRFPKANSAYHQAIEHLVDNLEVEVWVACIMGRMRESFAGWHYAGASLEFWRGRS